MFDVGERAWIQLAYQFGHELGHLLCNSWLPSAKPSPPCQWLEEVLAESFSLRALRLLAQSWQDHPPFPHDEGYAASVFRLSSRHSETVSGAWRWARRPSGHTRVVQDKARQA
jgi:hypothetical protein